MTVIGVFPEETAAFELITKLSWIIPLLLTIFSLLELVMVYVYQKYLHPWASIFAEEDLTNTNDQVKLFKIYSEPGTDDEETNRVYFELTKRDLRG